MRFPDENMMRLIQQVEEQRRMMRAAGLDDLTLQRIHEQQRLLDSIGYRKPDDYLIEQAMRARDAVNSPAFDFVRSANSSALRLIEDIRPKVAEFESLYGVPRRWVRELELFRHDRGLPDATLEMALGARMSFVTERSLLAQSALSQLDLNNTGRAVQVDESLRSALRDRFIEFTHSYSTLFKSYEEPQTSVLALPPIFSELPTNEFFAGVDVVRVSTDGDVEDEGDEFNEDRRGVRRELATETGDGLHALLVDLDPELIRMREGALHALASDNPDRVRHFTVSYRELLTHVLHKLSPDDEVRTWSTSQNDYANGKPTRDARLRFITRGINHGPLTDFFKKDIAAMVAVLNLFHGGTHAVTSSHTEAQLLALKMKAELTLLFLLETARATSEGH
jgi:hypothetical protein